MSPSRIISAAAALAIAATLALATAAQAADLPANSRDGVTAKKRKNLVTFAFGASAAKTYRSIAGRVVSISCSEVQGDLLGLSIGDDGTEEVRAPKRGRRLRAEVIVRGADFCTIFSTERERRNNGQITVERAAPIVSVPLTRQGAVFVEELDVTTDVAVANSAATLYGQTHKKRLPTFAQLRAVFTKAKLRFPLTALPNPAATPPLGRVGYFSDGSTATAVAVARTGRRLYIEVAPDNRLSTNVANYLFGDS